MLVLIHSSICSTGLDHGPEKPCPQTFMAYIKGNMNFAKRKF